MECRPPVTVVERPTSIDQEVRDDTVVEQIKDTKRGGTERDEGLRKLRRTKKDEGWRKLSKTLDKEDT